MYEFSDVVEDAYTLRQILGKPFDAVVKKSIDHLDKHCDAFIFRSPFLLIASSDNHGNFDISPKGDPLGFVKILDQHTLLIPERLGNRRADTYHNVLENPKVGIIFMIPGKKETLRVSGSARIVRDEPLIKDMKVKKKVPDMALAVYVTEAFFHCAKCMIRSELWNPESWPSLDGLPTLAETMIDGGKLKMPELALKAGILHDEKFRLY